MLTSLMFSATLKKATVLEQWLINHRVCYPPPALEFSNDNMFEIGRCSCGDEIEITVIISVVPKIKMKAKSWLVA